MELKGFLRNSSNTTLSQNKDLLEEYGLLNVLGSPKRVFLKFLKSKNLNLSEDELTEELIEEFEDSLDSINVKLNKIQKQKEIIFKQRKVWINIFDGDDWVGTDLILHHDGISIDKTDLVIPYSDMTGIEIDEGGWSKNKFTIQSKNDEFTFEINEDNAIPLMEILKDNMDYSNFNEIDQLLELYDLYEEGKITKEEYEAKKNIIYSDDIYCTNCGEKLDSDSEFCSNCGEEVSR